MPVPTALKRRTRRSRLARNTCARAARNANAGGHSTSRYPLLTKFKKTNVKNRSPGAIQVQMNLVRSGCRNTPAGLGPNKKALAEPKHSTKIHPMVTIRATASHGEESVVRRPGTEDQRCRNA